MERHNLGYHFDNYFGCDDGDGVYDCDDDVCGDVYGDDGVFLDDAFFLQRSSY